MSNIIGIIAEDKSDVEVVKVIFAKYLDKHSFSTKKFVGKGSGRLRKKCSSWAENLRRAGCNHILVFHDLDENNEAALRKTLETEVCSKTSKNTLVIIPAKELEAWLLSDPTALKKVFSLSKTPKKIYNTEVISSPKEYLRDQIWKLGTRRYLNTVHNVKIANNVSLSNYRRCKSFKPLDKYLKTIST